MYYLGMKTNFINWLIDEMNQRGWSNSELARQADLVPSTVSTVISGKYNPGFDFCLGIAKAFDYPPDYVLRRAGLLPAAPAEDDPRYQQLLETAKNLSREELENALQYLLWRYKLQEEAKKKNEKPQR